MITLLKKGSEKKGLKKSLSLFEIFIFTISIFTFAYFIGNEFQFVSAAGGAAGAPAASGTNAFADLGETIPETGRVILYDSALPTPAANVFTPGGGSATTSSASTGLGAYPPGYGATSQEAAAGGYSGGAAEPGGFNLVDHLTTVISENWGSMALNLVVAVAIWAGIYFGIGALCPTCSKDMLSNLGLYLGGGYAAGSLLSILIAGKGAGSLFGLLGGPWGLAGLAAGFVLFLIFYRETRIDKVMFNCFPWQPQTGGADCDKCNKGEFPCTQYKCDSLGQMCKLLNAGTDQEECAYIGKNDIQSPVISAWSGPLTDGYSYVPDTARLPPDKGVIIKYSGSSDGCAPPFSRIDYGITLNEPGSCRIDTIRTDNITSMRITVDKGYYLYNHTLFSLNAGANESAAEGITYSSGGNYEVFVRCQDGNNNINTGTFVFKYCVQNTPDTTAPTIEVTNPINGMPVSVGTTSTKVDVYTNKPADCRWDHNNVDYDLMANTMSCSQSITDINANMLYKCTGTLTGLKDQTENKFYFRCKSYPNAASDADRVKNRESYVYRLIGTQPLVIDSVTPASGATIKDATQSVNVTLEAVTSAGYHTGDSVCYLKNSGASDSNYVKFLSDYSQVNYDHKQVLYLTRGNYDYSIKCCDLGGNCATQKTSFSVDTDFLPPVVVRAYNEGNNLKIITDESSECVYDTTSCSYNFDDGVKMSSSDNLAHTTEWNTNSNFYIKCKDEFGNKPNPDSCSITVRPFNVYQ